MTIAIFQVEDKIERFQYFEKIFLFTEIDIDVVLGMLFLILNNGEINFSD